MKKLILFIVGTLFTISAGTVYATEGYGAAGCGLGSLVFGNEPGFVQVFAATTNATSYSQLFGITSGTSNCEKQPKSFSNVRLNEFVGANMDNLAKDIAMGHGEALDTLAELIRISIQERESVYTKLQTNFSYIFSSENIEAADVIDRIISVINS